MKHHSNTVWSTRNECDHIRNIGYHRLTGKATDPDVTPEMKVKHLEGYLRGNALRRNWTGLNRAAILAFAQSELKKYRGLSTPRT
jgi:hypothetical protein